MAHLTSFHGLTRRLRRSPLRESDIDRALLILVRVAPNVHVKISPTIRIILQEGPSFRVRVTPSFSQGILLEHLIFRSNPHHRDRVAPLSTTGGSRWACGIRQDGPGCGSRVSPQTRPKAFRADASSILHDPFRGTYPSGYLRTAEAIFRRALVLPAEAVGTVPIHNVPCGTPPRSSFSGPRTAYEGR